VLNVVVNGGSFGSKVFPALRSERDVNKKLADETFERKMREEEKKMA
jgi:hypothetical protein